MSFNLKIIIRLHVEGMGFNLGKAWKTDVD